MACRFRRVGAVTWFMAAMKLAWVSMAPLGLPVVPDV
ncbi:MAG: hypothetical protein BWX71_00475 [Deltaproteobacteria bacterium ADurb.Bin072]|nr:MAG: hypothetical protein BWX71_00475 [Deltaproteobacteria bacterium ADurb.Bin072]